MTYQTLKDAREKKPDDLVLLQVADLQGRETSTRRWCVPEWIPDRQVTSLYGDGGTGKSLLALQLATACALGTDFFGIDVASRTVLYVSCEDDQDELQIRQSKINAALGIEFADLAERYYWLARPGEDSILMTFDRKDGRGRPTAFAHSIRTRAKDHGAQLVVIDTAADVFGGLEIDRSQVRQFLSYLRKLAIELDGAVLLLAHPSVAGMRDKSGYSGSTAWRGGVRSLLTFEYPGDDDADPDRRILTRKKANYAKAGTEIGVRYEDGVFLAMTPEVSGSPLDEANTEYLYLKALRKVLDAGLAPSPSDHRKEFAPRLVREYARKEVGDIDFKRLKTAHSRLREKGKIAVFTPHRSNVVAPADYDFSGWKKPKI